MLSVLIVISYILRINLVHIINGNILCQDHLPLLLSYIIKKLLKKSICYNIFWHFKKSNCISLQEYVYNIGKHTPVFSASADCLTCYKINDGLNILTAYPGSNKPIFIPLSAYQSRGFCNQFMPRSTVCVGWENSRSSYRLSQLRCYLYNESLRIFVQNKENTTSYSWCKALS